MNMPMPNHHNISVVRAPIGVPLEIDPQLRSKAPLLKLGVILAAVEIKAKDDALWKELCIAGNHAAEALKAEGALAATPSIAAARTAYKECGKEPSRYRVSSEALIRRVIGGKDLYRINTVVDVNNLISIESKHSVGAYDLDTLRGTAVFRIGKIGETYKGIGKDYINIEGLPVFADEEGPFGSPTSDSQRSMITLETKNIMMVVIAFNGDTSLPEFLETAKMKLTQYAGATEVRSLIIE